MLFADGDNDFPAASGFERQGLVTSLSGPETTLRVRRYRRQRLAIDIVSNGKPVSDAVLWSDRGLGVCGAGYGQLATADSQGRIRVDPFYPEEWSTHWICADRKQVWVLPDTGDLPTRINLGETQSGDPNSLADVCK